MKSYSDLWRCVAVEVATWCHTSTTRDFKTVLSRVKNEGMSFFTITLPNFGKDFERSLDQGRVDHVSFPGFRRRGGLPVFMSGFLSQVFDVEDGSLLSDPSVDSILAIRQLTGMFAKIELPCSNYRVVRAMEGYVEIDAEIGELERMVPEHLIQMFRRTSNSLYADVFSRVDLSVFSNSVEPRHGPGGTADGLRGNSKFKQHTWTERLEAVFPYGEYCIPNWRYNYLLDGVRFLDPAHETPVKVIPVPKTLKGPRIIAMEPTCMQYMQQAVLQRLVRELEDPEELVSNFLGFEDQIPNREMAREGSLTGSLATLDLSEASDRVPYWLVKVMLEYHPWLLEAVDATRSTRAEIPILGLCIPQLKKFASMGSALCFPFEAMVFLTVVTMGIYSIEGDTNCGPPSQAFLRKYLGKVRVYGDDIIVPVHCVDAVISMLEAFGFRVNKSKSFWNGKFRESCGGDFYDGEDVTPIRLRKEFPSSLRDGSKVAALVEFRNHLYSRGFWKTAKWLDEEVILSLTKGYFPIVEPTSPILGRLSVLPWEAEKIDEATHSPLVRGLVLRPRIPENSVRDEWALVKCLTSSEIHEDERHLDRSGRPSVVDTKLKWMTPF